MKKLLCIGMLALPALTMAQSGGEYVVKGKIKNLKATDWVYLQYRKAGTSVIDSAKGQNGMFEFKGTVTEPMRAVLLMKRGIGQYPQSEEIYLEKGIINITGADSLKEVKVSGTPTNADNEAYGAMIKPVYAKYDALEAKEKAASEAQKAEPKFKKEMNDAEEAISDEVTAVNTKFISTHPKSIISLNLLPMLAYSMDYAEVAPLYAKLAPELKATEAGKKTGERIDKMKVVAIGVAAPEISQADSTGKLVTLSSMKGKYVLVDFWASWCGPCRAENPNVVKVYDKYKNRNFTILGVSLDQEKAREKWLAAIKTDGLKWTQVSDLKGWQNAGAQQYAVNAIPQNFLIDPKGKIVAKNLRGDKLEAAVAKYLK